MSTYRAAHEITAGDVIYLAATSTTPSLVTAVRESAHGVANACGAIVFDVETYITAFGVFAPSRPFTAWPNTTYRLESDIRAWFR